MSPVAIDAELVAKLTANGGQVPLTDADVARGNITGCVHGPLTVHYRFGDSGMAEVIRVKVRFTA